MYLWQPGDKPDLYAEVWCVAGMHRSVTIAEMIVRGLRQRGLRVRIKHLELEGHLTRRYGYGFEEYRRFGADGRGRWVYRH